MLLALGAGVSVSVLFYSSFFTNARGPLDSILTYGNYFTRAADEGGGHEQPFYFYAKLLLWNATALGVWGITSMVGSVEENRMTWLVFGICAVAGRMESESSKLGGERSISMFEPAAL